MANTPDMSTQPACGNPVEKQLSDLSVASSLVASLRPALANFKNEDVREALTNLERQCQVDGGLSEHTLWGLFAQLCQAAAREDAVECMRAFLPHLPLDEPLQNTLLGACFCDHAEEVAREFRSFGITDPKLRFESARFCFAMSPTSLSKYIKNFDLTGQFDRNKLIMDGLVDFPEGMHDAFPSEVALLLKDETFLKHVVKRAASEPLVPLWSLLRIKVELETDMHPAPEAAVLRVCQDLCERWRSEFEKARGFSLIYRLIESSVPPTTAIISSAKKLDPAQLRVVLPHITGQQSTFSAALLGLVVGAVGGFEVTSRHVRNLKLFMAQSPWMIDATTFKEYSARSAASPAAGSQFLLGLKGTAYGLIFRSRGDTKVHESPFFEAIVNSIYRPKHLQWAKIKTRIERTPERAVLALDSTGKEIDSFSVLCMSKLNRNVQSPDIKAQPSQALRKMTSSSDMEILRKACEVVRRLVPPGITTELLHSVGATGICGAQLDNGNPTLGEHIILSSLFRIATAFAAAPVVPNSVEEIEDRAPGASSIDSVGTDVRVLSSARKIMNTVLQPHGLKWRVIYSVPHARDEAYLARDAMGLSSARDRQSWRDPKYHQILHFDLETASLLGVTQIHLFNYARDERGMLIRPNPTDSLGRDFDPRDVAHAMLELPRVISDELGLEPFLPEQTEFHLLTNREWLKPALEALVGETMELEVRLTKNLSSYLPRRLK